MNAVDHLIPADRLALIAALRCAINGRPECAELSAADPRALFRQAREHGVDTYLYPWLTSQKGFSETRAGGVEVSLEIWRQAFLSNLVQSDVARRLLQTTLTRLARAGLDAIVLKGAWLGTTVYDDPAQRRMSDIDLLVRRESLDAVHRELVATGFAADKDTLHNRFAYEQGYRHPGLPLPLELHWHMTSELTPSAPVPDIDAVWRRALDSAWHGAPVKAMQPADQLAHLTQHILHHLFAAPLRGYLDIALLLKKHGSGLSVSDVAAASARWRTGSALPFLMNMTAALLETPLPRQLEEYCGDMRPADAETAITALFNLPEARERAGESTLSDFREASSVGKLRLILRRVFMPRQFMMLYYPCARTRLGLPRAWFKRAVYLYRRSRSLAAAATEDSVSDQRRQDIARQRRQLTEKLLLQT